jgi:HlyD family secretion protein
MVLARSEQLAQSGAIAGDELDRARAQSMADGAAERAAKARKEAVKAGPRPEERSRAHAALAAAAARVSQAEAALEQRTLRAPIRGQVLQVRARIGEQVDPAGEPLVVLGDTSQLFARVDVDERDIGALAVGSSAVVRASAWPGREFEGEVVELGLRMGRKNVRTDDPVERNDTKILEVLVALRAPQGLVVGQRVTAFLERSAPEAPRPVVAQREDRPARSAENGT